MPGKQVFLTKEQEQKHLENYEATKTGWSTPYQPWVVETWRRHSESIGGPAIAAEFRKNLLDSEGARRAAGLKTKRKK